MLRVQQGRATAAWSRPCGALSLIPGPIPGTHRPMPHPSTLAALPAARAEREAFPRPSRWFGGSDTAAGVDRHQAPALPPPCILGLGDGRRAVEDGEDEN